jgi:hypothetical protein
MSIKKTALSAAVLMALGSGAAYAMGTPVVTTTGNNFTMLAGAGTLQGGTNDVTFQWDGTIYTSVITDGSNNATLSSPTPFAAAIWTAHNINIYGPGTYIFNTGCPAGNPSCTTASTAKRYELVIPQGYLGAHMLFDWSTSANIDVVQLWQINASWDATGSADPFCAAPLTNGSCNTNPNPNGNDRFTVWSAVSVDTPPSTVRLSDGSIPTAQPNEDNLYHGTKMIDGPFQGSSANFNLRGVPVPAAVWLLGSGLIGLVGVARRRKKA